MNINEMSDQEKTLYIINLMPDWSVWGGGSGDDIILQIGDKETAVLQAPNYLYNPKWMFLAWRVLNWAYDSFLYNQDAINELWDFWYTEMFRLPKDGLIYWLIELEPADAQRAWLDKILTLAFEAGMVTK